jgi:hypothetical protein
MTDMARLSPDQIEQFKGMIKEMAVCKDRIANQNEQCNEIAAKIKDEFQIAPKYSKKLAEAMHKDSTSNIRQEAEELEELLDLVFEGSLDG